MESTHYYMKFASHTSSGIVYSFTCKLSEQYTHVSGKHPDVHLSFNLVPAFAFPYRCPTHFSATVYYTLY